MGQHSIVKVLTHHWKVNLPMVKVTTMFSPKSTMTNCDQVMINDTSKDVLYRKNLK